MLKKSTLGLIASRRYKKRTIPEHLSYYEASKIGFLVRVEDLNDELDDIIGMLMADGKQVFTMAYRSKKSKQLESRHPVFGKSDISMLGESKSADLSTFLERDLDFLVSTDTTNNVFINYVMISCKTHCRIGYRVSDNNFLDLQVKTQDERQSLNEVLKYLKMIKQ
ncbi:MAG: hypothetical protein KI790_01045 [Cyclobacteriaceae bacterium]|nr:hypothetical protein [Cyclobacteriaceae bacterium HetDA_MAG_MS6]